MALIIPKILNNPMLKKIASCLSLLFVANILLSLSPISPASAAGASLFLSPAKGDYTVGKTFTVKVMVNSGGGVGINASEGNLTFDPAMLLVSKVDKSSSIFSLWTAEPTFSNKNGTIAYGGGSPSSFTGSAGAIMNIVFVARKEGVANVAFSSGMILAADGKGTDVYSGSGEGVYTIKAAVEPKPEEVKKEEVKPLETPATGKNMLPPAPDLSSVTHPDESKWYANNNPEFGWHLLGDLNGVGASLDESPTAEPSKTSIGLVDTKKFENVADGTHYVHARFKNNNGWGQIAHKKVMIDTTPPAAFEITIENGGDATNPTPIINFSTTDNASGVESYSLSLDGQVEEVASRNFNVNPYLTKLLGPGDHQITVVASDKAKNKASSTKSFKIEPLKMPVIKEFSRVIIQGEKLIVPGTSFYPEAVITVYLTKDEKDFDSAKVSTDGDGNWTYVREKVLDKANYEISVKVSDKRGAESNPTERKQFSVIAPSIIQVYGWWIIAVLLLIIAGLILFILYEKKRWDEENKRIKLEVEDIKNKMSEVFNALKEEVEELLEFADKKPGLSESEKRVKEKLREALDISEEFINKEVTDVEKEIK